MKYTDEQLKVYPWDQLNLILDSVTGSRMLCSINQYKLLMQCSVKKDMGEWNRWREENPSEQIMLCGADLSDFYLDEANLSAASLSLARCTGTSFNYANLQNARLRFADFCGADFVLANCQQADFVHANCRKVSFRNTNCLDADFSGSDCQDAFFMKSNCQNARFIGANCYRAKFYSANCSGAKFADLDIRQASFESAVLDHRTEISNIILDDETDFNRTSLASVIIDPGVKAKLEQIIRRKNWQRLSINKNEKDTLRIFARINNISSYTYIWLIKLFWHISDYGYSTRRVFFWFFWFVLMFGSLYTFCPYMLALNGVQMSQGHPIQMIAFATSTMVTLGFSNINVAIVDGKPHLWGMIAVSANLMVGYFMLAVLVTRLAIIFQTLGPGHTPPRTKKDHE